MGVMQTTTTKDCYLGDIYYLWLWKPPTGKQHMSPSAK